jgi:phage recombination protein Bet
MNENTQLAVLEKRGIDEALWSAIGSSIFPGASEESKLLAFDYCKARGLDILKKPCHIVPMNVKDAKTGQYSWRDVIMPGIAEQRITAHRTGQYAGQDAPVFGPSVNLVIGRDTHTVPEYCTVTVYRLIEGQRVGISNTEYFEEACGTVKDGSLNSMWTKRKRGQLAKCAEAGALRKAFPEELGGMITVDETEDIRDVTPRTGKAVLRETMIEPFESLPAPTEAKAEPASQPAADPAPNPETKAPEGRQQKERHVRDATFRGIAEKEGKGKTWWNVTLGISGKILDFTTFSKTLSGSLMDLDKGTQIRATIVQNADSKTFSIEDYTLIEEGGLV